MVKEETRKIKPFDCFARSNMWLMAAGYCKLYNPRNNFTKFCHKVYRKIVLFIVYVYTAQHIVHIVQMFLLGDNEKLVEAASLVISISAIALKATMFYVGTRRIDKLVDLMEDPFFGADSDKDEIFLKENALTMKRISDVATVGLSGVIVLWVGGPIIKRMQDPHTVIASYIPFHTDTWPRFLLANFLDTFGIVLWVGFGNINMDVAIATYYAQARVQLQIINYNLEHLFDNARSQRRNKRFQFLDILDESVQERFVFYIKRFERVCWFTDEVTSIFNLIVSMQFFVASFCSCLVIFQMSTADTLLSFGFSLGFYIVVQCEILLYCHYGGLVQHESKQMVDSLYLGEWLSVSPRFRRQLLIAMCRWIRPITPRVFGIVPLSLATFLSITRSAYTLFTVLKSKNNKGSGQRTLAF